MAVDKTNFQSLISGQSGVFRDFQRPTSTKDESQAQVAIDSFESIDSAAPLQNIEKGHAIASNGDLLPPPGISRFRKS